MLTSGGKQIGLSKQARLWLDAWARRGTFLRRQACLQTIIMSLPAATLATVILKPGEADRVILGHPWIYEGSILRTTATPKDGDVVQVKDHRQRFLGVGFWNSRSKINVRVLSCRREAIDTEFFERRIRAALAIRARHLPGATSFRVVNAESDFLSGLIVDKYEDVLVAQVTSLGMDQRKGDIVAALQKVLSPRAILERGDLGSRKFEGLAESSGVLAGELAPGTRVKVRLNGMEWETDLSSGHKTGMYLDQQTNYRLVADLAKRIPAASALDCFSFLGGFALHLAKAGVTRVEAVDQSQEANEGAARTASANGLAERCTFTTANVFDWLKSHTMGRPTEAPPVQYDLVVLDPPSFTRNRASVPDALRGYKEIHLRALRLLKPGGILATFCCSHHVSAGLFMEAIVNAAFDAQRVLRKVETFTQSADHPTLPSIPETEYLKGFAFEIAR